MRTITGLILAGGQGRRMGGVDKGLQPFRGKRLVDHVYERLVPQVGGIIINANQNHDDYRSFGVRVVSDALKEPGGGFAGPLAGLHAGLSISRRPYLATVPCDSPFFPHDLVERLFKQLNDSGAELAVARTGNQSHPVFCLVRRGVVEHLADFIKDGGRKIDAWYAALHVVEVAFDDEVAAFSNINTRDELASLEGATGAASARDTNASPAPPAQAHPTEPAATGPAAPVRVAPGQATLQQTISCIGDYDPDALPVARAREVIRAFVRPITGVEKVALRAALGRVLAADIISPIDVPAHDNSAMDGYAVISADLDPEAEVGLTEIGTAFAGREFRGEVLSGQCVRVMTGAVMPAGTDAVIIQESVKIEGERIFIPPGQQPGQNRRLAGEDLARGKPALLAGTWLRPAELGLLASLGMAEVGVRRRLRVAFFSTGDELRSIGEPLGEGQVYDSNRYTLWGMLTRLGCEVMDMGVVPDDEEKLEAAFRDAAACADAVVTSGGVSVGEADFTRALMARLGEVAFWKIAMRPGRPMAFGKVGDAYLFGLPGNPVAVMVTFYEFVRAALLAMMGRRDGELPLTRARSQSAIRKRPGRTEYQRGVLENHEGEWTVRLTGAQGSGILRSMAEANCLIVLGHEQGGVTAGELVDVLVMEGLA
ncbi:MAG: molybdenum cofactor guanylyltransferase [Betaproteobacteria bacterium]|nr:molybdenum cofactor guanylyltransferase [Betaproteobacteria bacterium]